MAKKKLEVFTEHVPTMPESEPRKTATGVVVNCSKLNIRKKPNLNSEILCLINVKDKLEIDERRSTDDFYKVFTATGISGYAMKKYLVLK